MTDVIDKERLSRVLNQARTEEWTGVIPGAVPPKIRLAIDSLRSSLPDFWDADPEEVARVLHENPGVRDIFERTPETHLAFAIRLARM